MGYSDGIVSLESRTIAACVNLMPGVHNGQLFSLTKRGVEYMHQGGKPSAAKGAGWDHSELIMFPVVGRARQYDAACRTFPMSQHGLARHLPWVMIDDTPASVFLEQIYEGGLVRNTKYRGDASEQEMLQGLPYLLQKSYRVDGYAAEKGLTARFSIENVGDDPLPYEWGWHPAFRADNDAIVRVAKNVIPLAELQKLDGASKHSAQEAVLETGGRRIELRSDAEFMQIWSPPASSLICMEPITKHPYAEAPTKTLMPGEEKTYTVDIVLA